MKKRNREAGSSRRKAAWLAPLFFCLVMVVVALWAVPVQARSYYFPRVLIEAELHPDGSMSVVEERTFSFDGEYHGAWQYIYLKNNASIKDVLVSEQGRPYSEMPAGTQGIPGILCRAISRSCLYRLEF